MKWQTPALRALQAAKMRAMKKSRATYLNPSASQEEQAAARKAHQLARSESGKACKKAITTILFETADGHDFNGRKLFTVLSGLLLAWFASPH